MGTRQKAVAAEHERQVLEAAIAGLSFRQMAPRVGMSPAGAQRAFQRALLKTIQPAAEEARAVHRLRLEAIWRTHYPAMERGDLAATDRCLKVLSQLATLLGLNAATVNWTLLVEDAAQEFGLTAEERAALQASVRAHLASTRSGAG